LILNNNSKERTMRHALLLIGSLLTGSFSASYAFAQPPIPPHMFSLFDLIIFAVILIIVLAVPLIIAGWVTDPAEKFLKGKVNDIEKWTSLVKWGVFLLALIAEIIIINILFPLLWQ